MKYDVCVVGLGYIGLPTAAVFADAGKKVLGVDRNASVVDSLKRGKVHIVEPGLDSLVEKHVSSGRLDVACDIAPSRAFILAVPTPITTSKSADISFVLAAARTVALVVEAGDLVVVESTSPPGTTEAVARIVTEERPDLVSPEGTFSVLFAHAPERVLPGNALTEIIYNDRILGGTTPEATHRATELYSSFVAGNIHSTDAVTAEFVKLTENAFRDVNIAFANELSTVASELGINIWDAIGLANHHPRVNIMQPGPGVGGHCIAVDPWFIVDAAPQAARLIRTAREVNDSRPARVVQSVQDLIESTQSRSLAILGLSFKKNIDDLRSSPAMTIAVDLVRRMPQVKFHVSEPHLEALPSSLNTFNNVVLSHSASEAISSSEVVLLLVDHDLFLDTDVEQLRARHVIDTRGLWNAALNGSEESVTP